MTENEKRRYYDGRYDWKESAWQDHCGNPDCDQCIGLIPEGNPLTAQLRKSIFLLPDNSDEYDFL